ncbi:histidinol dehydrogenase [Nakamurella antarctica]|uniref:Histidinol dehydrogenase n=1 Tax=Nakamurella antarctica TaxID=1902245 RepID=A0A3G8ZLU8_9ACTN|nr:histidinol dehydrogenase [Nakamurella antarctica]AZI57805.1 histidinol dehydrogenase [Nakamurella antarctica]
MKLNRIDLRAGLGDIRAALPRGTSDTAAAAATVATLVADVRERGASAVLDATEKFDGVRPPTLRVPASVIAEALQSMDPAVRAALTESISRARLGHQAQMPVETVTEIAVGAVVGQRWVPVRRVGLYVPGGLALYPSSVVMNVVPAQVAGVDGIAVTSPPQRSTGWPDGNVLAACALLGIDEVYAAGGAQAIALLGYGAVDTDGTVIDGVDVITGPGNVYVTAAKRLLRGTVAIDSEAGPTEIAVIADDSANPVHVAADLISQAEHDPLASSVLITTSETLAAQVDAELTVRVPATKHAARVAEALSGRQSATVLVSSIDDAVAVADAYAAEHLEIQTVDAAAVAARIRNAGAIFVGSYTPVSVGDYCAGSNHVLPTTGSARFSSGLNVTTFLKSLQVVTYDAGALREVADHVLVLSKAEDLPAHGEAVSARFES